MKVDHELKSRVVLENIWYQWNNEWKYLTIFNEIINKTILQK